MLSSSKIKKCAQSEFHSELNAILYNIMLNSLHQHNCFITQSNYIGYTFRLLISHLQAYFNRFSHKMLYTHWDPSVFTSMVYIKLDHLPRKV